MDPENQTNREVNPRKSANIFSVITFFYNFQILKKGKRKDIEEKDVYKVLPNFEAKKLGDKLESQWQKDKSRNKNASLLLCLTKCFGWIYLLYAIVQLAFGTGMLLLQPMVFSKFVAYFEPDQKSLTKNDAYLYASAVVGLDLLSRIYNQNFSQLIVEYSIQVRTALSSLIFRKSLKISPTSFSEITIGKVITFLSKDVYSLNGALMFLKDMIIGYLQLIVVTYLLYKRVGLSAFYAIGVLLAIILIQLFSGILVRINRLKTVKKSDKRYKILQETLSAIKIVKMYVWQNYFKNIIQAARIKEIEKLKIVYWLKALIIGFGGSAISLSFYSLLISYIKEWYTIDAETVYFIQQCLSALGSAITTSIPWGISQSSDTLASLKRIQAFLVAEELEEKNDKIKIGCPKVYLNKVKVAIDKKEIIECASMNLNRGLLLVTGNTGSGKTVLLKTILGEFPYTDGDMEVDGSISYAPEEPWLFPSTIRQNILFGQTYDENRYQEVLKVCDLIYDLKKFDMKDFTIVGDNGINLSKGQQARISLARAIYKDSGYLFTGWMFKFIGQSYKIIDHDTIDEPVAYNKEKSVYRDTESEGSENLQCLLKRNIDEKITGNLFHEKNKDGKVLWKTYLKYFRFLGGIIVCLYLIVIFTVAQFCTSYADKLISKWVDLEPNITEMINKNETNSTEYTNAIRTRNEYLTFYTILIVSALALFVLKGCSTYYFCLKAAIRLHEALITAMLNCYMYFFDDHFIGNIINRLSKDFYTIDEYMPFLVFDCSRVRLMVYKKITKNHRIRVRGGFWDQVPSLLLSVFSSIGTIILLASVNWGFIVLIVLLFVTLFFLLRFYLPTGRSLRRLEAATRSPVIGYLNSTLEGISVLRATKQQEIVRFEFDRHQNLNTSAYYMNQTTTRLFAFLVDILGNLFILGITFKFILLPSDTKAGGVGLAISQAMSLSQVLQWVFKQIAEVETVMTSVERVLEYTDAPIENIPGKRLVNWPSLGNIRYTDVSLYYTSENDAILKNMTFDVKENNKIGIVGRTGAGKSSLVATLFRLYNFKGQIKIDDEDICEVPLDVLRSSIAIIPQDPILFSGTIRTNIDPLEKYSDEDIWNALEMVQVKHLIYDLNQPVNYSSTNFSAGQRQLICLARAIIQRNKIIILDEATANLDNEMDKLLQETVKYCFENCTVLTITHRLSSIRSCDKVLVLDAGSIVEFDTPDSLLTNNTGFFFKLLREDAH